MNFISKLLGRHTETAIRSNKDFWNWFKRNRNSFFKAIKYNKDIENNFFDRLVPKLNALKEGYFLLAGMCNDKTVELIITPDGNVKNVVFVEELVSAAPAIEGWKFTALKPAHDIKNVGITIAGYDFNEDTQHFYADHSSEFPDEIAIVMVHDDLNDQNRPDIINGSYLFLDNYLGELNFMEVIDILDFEEKKKVKETLIPIGKLKGYLSWRQKEFIEKYDGIRTGAEEDSYSILEARLKNGRKLIATINTALLAWEGKVSHPWILTMAIEYNGASTKGLPDDACYRRLNILEDELLSELKSKDGYLYIGRQSANNLREIYFACMDFRKPSKVAYQLQEKYKASEKISYDIYKDKYWKSFNRFNQYH
jgi:hypothetical protein